MAKQDKPKPPGHSGVTCAIGLSGGCLGELKHVRGASSEETSVPSLRCWTTPKTVLAYSSMRFQISNRATASWSIAWARANDRR